MVGSNIWVKVTYLVHFLVPTFSNKYKYNQKIGWITDLGQNYIF